jgi:hypothetical protein
MIVTALLIVHGLLAVVLLGAVTHQALALASRPPAGRKQSFFNRFASVNAPAYVNPIIFFFVLTSIGGALLYPQYRIDVRPVLEDLQMRQANGIFEIKEHFAAIGLGLLPAYWFYWQPPLVPQAAGVRRYLTWILAFLIWWNFLVGHVLNNIRGLLA